MIPTKHAMWRKKKGVSNHQIQQEDNFSYKMRYIQDLQFLLDSLFDRDNRSGNNHRVEYLISSLFVTDRFSKMILFLAKRIGAEIRISISKRKFEKKRRFSLSLSSVLLLRDTISNLILRENGWPTRRGQARTSNKFPRINGDQTPTRGSVILVTM